MEAQPPIMLQDIQNGHIAMVAGQESMRTDYRGINQVLVRIITIYYTLANIPAIQNNT